MNYVLNIHLIPFNPAIYYSTSNTPITAIGVFVLNLPEIPDTELQCFKVSNSALNLGVLNLRPFFLQQKLLH